MTGDKAKKPIYTKVWFWAIVVVVVFAIAIGSGGGDNASTSASSNAQAAPTEAASTAATTEAAAATTVGIGQPLTVGDLVFTVTSAGTIDELDFYGETKTGHWELISINIQNNGKEAVTIDSSFFKLLESDGTVYETDSDSIMYIDSEKSLFLEAINPKLSKDGEVLFAIPTSAIDLTLQVQTGYFGTETGEISLVQ